MIATLAFLGTSEILLIAAVVGVLGIIGIGTIVLVVWAVTRSKLGAPAAAQGQRPDAR